MAKKPGVDIIVEVLFDIGDWVFGIYILLPRGAYVHIYVHSVIGGLASWRR